MVILRYFRLICVTGVVVSAISFLLGTLAISTGHWLLSIGEVSPDPTKVSPSADSQGPGPVTSAAPGNFSDWNSNSTGNATTPSAVITTELTLTTDPTTAVPGTLWTGTTSRMDASENATTAKAEMKVVMATSGLWQICQSDVEDGVVVNNWLCWNVIQNLAAFANTKELRVIAGRTANRVPHILTSSTDPSLTVYIETSGVYFQSMLAFELISVAATLAGCCIATIAIYKEQPLAVLVAAFTMFFAGMFMLVGHLMMLSIHKVNDESTGTSKNSWFYGWSFVVAWLSFSMCLVSGIVNCIVYRNFRKMSEELTGTPSRVKYANRPPPVSLGSSI